MLAPNLIRVEFGSNYPSEVQGHVMLMLEKYLREMGFEASVEKHIKGDDSKLRVRMTQEERDKL